MTTYVAVHGAFRGPWYWEPLAAVLATSGDALHAVDLQGTDLESWIDCVTSVVRDLPPGVGPVVLLGHSMGGVVAQAATAELCDLVDDLVLLDSPLIGPGQRAVDVSGPVPPEESRLPARDVWIQPTPVGPAQGFDDPALGAWVNDRLRPVPMGPQLDPLPQVAQQFSSGPGTPGRTVRRLVFCDRTPQGYPSTFARRVCVDQGVDHLVLDAHHDVAVLQPELVADVLRNGGTPSNRVARPG